MLNRNFIYLIILIIMFLGALQGAFLSLNLVLLVVALWASFRPIKEVLWIAFLAGIMIDLAQGSALGLSSLLYLVVALLPLLYRRRFDPTHPVFLPIFVFLVAILYDRLIGQSFSWRNPVLLSFLAFLIRLILFRVVNLIDKDTIKLS